MERHSISLGIMEVLSTLKNNCAIRAQDYGNCAVLNYEYDHILQVIIIEMENY